MSNLPTASIVVPTRGGAQRLPVLLNALSLQDTADFEAIVVLDGDIDDSEGILRRAAEEASFSLRWVVFSENRGRSAALNAGADAARGRVLIRCDDDLEPAPDYVSGHLARHQGEASGAIGLYLNRLPDTPYARAYGTAADERFRAQALATPNSLQWRFWAGNVSVLRTVHDRIGGYDERYRTYGWEDVDYGYRLHQAGVPVRIAPELSTPHHVAATTTPIRALRALHSGAAREVFVNTHGVDVLGAGPSHTGLWGRAVWAASTVATEKSIRTWSAVVDRAADALPRPVAEKLIALAVESAGLAGIRYPKRARSRF
jgi:glycosyltransferase involved in cell wall biosynthesis